MPSTNDPLDPFAPVTPAQLAAKARASAQKSVQSSLFRRLGTKGFGRAGHLAWLLCFAADPSSAKGERARAKLAERSSNELRLMLDAANACLASGKAGDEWRDYARGVVNVLRDAMQNALVVSTPASSVTSTPLSEETFAAQYTRLTSSGMTPEEAFAAIDASRAKPVTERAR